MDPVTSVLTLSFTFIGHNILFVIKDIIYINSYNHLISYDMGGTIIVWDLSTKSLLYTITKHNTVLGKYGVNGLKFDKINS